MDLPLNALSLKTILIFRPEAELGPYVAVRLLDAALLRADRNARKRGPSEQAIRASIRQGSLSNSDRLHSPF
jgi:hypothetical protein